MKFLELDDYTQETINDLLDSNLEESINIEFKSSQALSKEPSVKKEISKDISAFANSDGGLIFYGINEVNHIASSLSFIDGNIITKEWLENVIISNIQPKIKDLKIFPVRFNDEISKTVYVVKIPNSNVAPHISSEKKYFRRFNFQSVPMEEYEVRNLYLRQRESKVFVDNVVVKPIEEKKENQFCFYIEIQVINEGSFVSEKYKVACDFKESFGTSLNYDTTKNYSVTNILKEGVKVSNNTIVPLFPNEIFNALSFTLNVPKDIFNDIVSSMKFSVLIFNLTEFDETEIDLASMLLKIKDEFY
jgi:hypothetical protein